MPHYPQLPWVIIAYQRPSEVYQLVNSAWKNQPIPNLLMLAFDERLISQSSIIERRVSTRTITIVGYIAHNSRCSSDVYT
jgi:hypothetical protein